jgi:hypothetical protein
MTSKHHATEFECTCFTLGIPLAVPYRQAARALQVSPATLDREAALGRLKMIRLGRLKKFITKESMAAYLAAAVL